MSQFKTREEYIADEATKIRDVIFNIATKEGPVRLTKSGTSLELLATLKRYNTEGVIIYTARGYTWFPSGTIIKVDVEEIKQ